MVYVCTNPLVEVAVIQHDPHALPRILLADDQVLVQSQPKLRVA